MDCARDKPRLMAGVLEPCALSFVFWVLRGPIGWCREGRPAAAGGPSARATMCTGPPPVVPPSAVYLSRRERHQSPKNLVRGPNLVKAIRPLPKVERPLCVPKTQIRTYWWCSHRQAHETQCVRCAEPVGLSGHLCSRNDGSAPHCNSERMSAGPGASAARPTPPRGQRTHGGWSQSIVQQNSSATVMPPKSVCRGCPWPAIGA